MRDEITDSFPSFNGSTVEVWEWISNFISLYWACDYLSVLVLKLIHVSKRGLSLLTHDIQTKTAIISSAFNYVKCFLRRWRSIRLALEQDFGCSGDNRILHFDIKWEGEEKEPKIFCGKAMHSGRLLCENGEPENHMTIAKDRSAWISNVQYIPNGQSVSRSNVNAPRKCWIKSAVSAQVRFVEIRRWLPKYSTYLILCKRVNVFVLHFLLCFENNHGDIHELLFVA